MQNDNNDHREVPRDPHLDAPSVANQDKHINFREEAEKADESILRINTSEDDTKQRREQWEEGLAEGKENNDDQTSFQKRDLNEQEEE